MTSVASDNYYRYLLKLWLVWLLSVSTYVGWQCRVVSLCQKKWIQSYVSFEKFMNLLSFEVLQLLLHTVIGIVSLHTSTLYMLCKPVW